MMNEGRKKSYDIHTDIAKQLITICTGLIALAIGAARVTEIDFSLNIYVQLILWSFAVSIISGILHLGALASAAENSTNIQKAKAVIYMARAQQIFFVIVPILILGLSFFIKWLSGVCAS